MKIVRAREAGRQGLGVSELSFVRKIMCCGTNGSINVGFSMPHDGYELTWDLSTLSWVCFHNQDLRICCLR